MVDIYFFSGLVPALLLIVSKLAVHFGLYLFLIASWDQVVTRRTIQVNLPTDLQLILLCIPSVVSTLRSCSHFKGNANVSSFGCTTLAGIIYQQDDRPLSQWTSWRSDLKYRRWFMHHIYCILYNYFVNYFLLTASTWKNPAGGNNCFKILASSLFVLLTRLDSMILLFYFLLVDSFL